MFIWWNSDFSLLAVRALWEKANSDNSACILFHIYFSTLGPKSMHCALTKEIENQEKKNANQFFLLIKYMSWMSPFWFSIAVVASYRGCHIDINVHVVFRFFYAINYYYISPKLKPLPLRLLSIQVEWSQQIELNFLSFCTQTNLSLLFFASLGSFFQSNWKKKKLIMNETVRISSWAQVIIFLAVETEFYR